MNLQNLLRVATLLVAGAVTLVPDTLCFAATAPPRTIEITAGKDNVFHLPGNAKVLYLKAGEQVHFRITSGFGGERARDGSVHSFTVRNLRDQGWDIRLKEGPQEFTLIAPPAGEYLVECAVKCGPGHDTMNFKMVVQ
jgi:heme/copper-type cytochrome/quinol oxidase subunit 2